MNINKTNIQAIHNVLYTDLQRRMFRQYNARTNEFNLSQNLSFWSGSTYEIRHSDMVTNPQVYISEVGLYDNQNSLVAVGRLSSPINKNYSSEAIVKVRLTY